MKKDKANFDTSVILHLDTSRSDVLRVALEDAGVRRIVNERDITVTQAQEALPLIEELLSRSKHTLDDITAIQVNTGPGSYTGLRVGVAIANMLGALLGVPINGLPVGQTVSPTYEGDRYKS